MSQRVRLQQDPLPIRREKYSPEMLRRIGVQVEDLLSRYSSLEMYRRSIDQQLVVIAAQIHEEDVLLLPRNVFLLLEVRGSGGVSAQIEQIARILGEVGYSKPSVRVQKYRLQDVYHLGKSAQKLFDDHAVLAGRVKQLHFVLARIRERWQMKPGTTPQEVFAGLATTLDGAEARAEVDAVVELLEHATHPAGFRWLFVHLSMLLLKAEKNIHSC